MKPHTDNDIKRIIKVKNMDEKTREVLRKVMKSFADISYIRPEEIPEIPLYMDQITTFMDSRLASCKRHPDDKIMTKTMINNYTKNKLMPPPEKKKYSRDHLILMIYIYYLKDFLSISDIKTILEPLVDRYFQNTEDKDLEDIYRSAYDLLKSQQNAMTRQLMDRFKLAEKAFPKEESDEDDYLPLFAFICLLSFDVYIEKRLIEAVVDGMKEISSEEPKEQAAKKQASGKKK